ncbi:MAG: hypothetical protein WCT54_03020 [Patescibacteria group bacterium]
MRKFLVIASCLLTLALVGQWIRLPLVHQGIWMSPDEAANALAAVHFAGHGSFAVDYPLAASFNWAVPRSFTVLPGQIAPIGFLGMPLILAFAFKLFGIFGLLFLTPLIALAALWPLWKSLPVKWNEGAKWSVLLVWISFPTVIIYANRGAFGNLFLVCLAIWIWWMLTKVKTIWRYPVTGFLLGLALMIRPPEAIWLLPVALFAFLYRHSLSSSGKSDDVKSRADHVALRETRGSSKINQNKLISGFLFVIPLLITLSLGAYLGHQTYARWFVSGYQIRSTYNLDAAQHSSSVETYESYVNSVSVFDTFPIGVHPRNLAWNVWQYVIKLFWPWTVVCLLAVIIAVREKIWRKSEKWVAAAFAWTTIWLIVFYGNGVYQDHVGVNVASMGNSFLRYLLPLSVVAAVSVGYVLERLWKVWSLKIIAACIVIVIVGMGQWYSINKDDEGMAANAKEMGRYAQIRDDARSWLDPATIVVSDRNDKVFFPIFQSVSPLPDDARLKLLLDNDYSVALFLTTQEEKGLADWSDRGFALRGLFSNGNQTMYEVKE